MTASDLVLLAYIVLIVPAMLVGFVFARRKMFVPYHKFTMTTITIVNWVIILAVMLVTYRRDVVPNIPQNLGLPGVLIPTLHLIPGLIAQLLATYLVIRMWFENQLPDWFKVNNIKLFMRTTLCLWLLTAVLGVVTWAVINKGFLASPSTVPIATPAAGVTVVRLLPGNKYDPVDITVAAGTTIEFINTDGKTHTVTADDGSFDSGDLKAGTNFQQAFPQAGTFQYYCSFHGDKGGVGMSAVIHVKASDGSVPAAATAKPTAVVTAAPAAATQNATQSANAGTNSAVTVNLNDDVFAPKTVTVPVGSVIRFLNAGKHKHTVTADDGSFDSGQLTPGQTFEHTFDKVGDVPVYCMNHGDKGGVDMSMVVHVTAAGSAPASASTQAAAGALAPDAVAALAPLVVSALDTPGKIPYVVGAQSQMALVVKQSATIIDALKQGHYEDAQAAAEAIQNVLESGKGTDFDKDGKVNQPGDGFGLRLYIFGLNEAAASIPGIEDLISGGRAAVADIQIVKQQAQALIAAPSLVEAQKVEPLLTGAVSKLQSDMTTIVKAAAALKVPDNHVSLNP